MTSKGRRSFLKFASAASTGAILTSAKFATAQSNPVNDSATSLQSVENLFDLVPDRRGTNSIKWEFSYHDPVPAEITHDFGASPISGPLPMSVSDMEFKTAPEIISALKERAQHGVYGYTKPTEDYYQAISRWVVQQYSWRVEEDWMLFTPGVMPAISMAIQAHTQPGDKIIIQPPVFYPFTSVVENNDRVLLRSSLVLENDEYVMDFDDLEAKAADSRTKMIILCSPHNPVGRVWSQKELARLGEICEAHDLIIVSDEIHCDLVYSWAKFTTFGVVEDRFLDRLIVCNSPSKSFNLPGLKTATTIIPNPELRDGVNIVLRNFEQLFSVNVFGTLALQTAYEKGEPWLNQLKSYLETNYLYTESYIDEHIPSLRLHKSEGLYLVWIDCRKLGLDEDELRSLFVDKAKVYPTQGIIYGAEGAGFVRLNIACAREVLEEALTRISVATSRV